MTRARVGTPRSTRESRRSAFARSRALLVLRRERALHLERHADPAPLPGMLSRHRQERRPIVDVADCISTLRAAATELDELSRTLHDTEKRLEPVEREYRTFVDDFEVGLWKQH